MSYGSRMKKTEGSQSRSVMNRLDPIKELYDMYLEEEDTPRIVEIEDDGLTGLYLRRRRAG